MNGQWMGDFNGTSNGTLLLNVDDRGTHFDGVGYFTPSLNDVPRTGVGFKTIDKSRDFAFKTKNMWLMDPESGNWTTWDQIKHLYPPGLSLASEAEVSGSWDETALKVSWKTDNGVTGTSVLPRSRASLPSDLRASEMRWNHFKAFVDSFKVKRHLFRGQSDRWRLRSAFHRSGRANLLRFMTEDIVALQRVLSVRTRHVFNRANPDENGAFYNLVQHHGYPTPLLDWTYSPYVAAFFAYRNVPKSEAGAATATRRVRIFVLDESWRTDFNQVTFLDRNFPHFSVLEFLAIENERMVPQQSVSALTTIDDIESYISEKGRAKSKTYLTAIDLPASERAEVFRDLDYMGVTAGSLFPGLDGACEELRERNF